MIETITISLKNGNVFSLRYEDARDVWEDLNRIFGKRHTPIPYPPAVAVSLNKTPWNIY